MARTGAWLALSALIVAADQLVKYAAVQALAGGKVVAVTPFFNLVLVYNRGAAFSILSDAAGWQRWLLIAIALVASAWIVWLLSRHASHRLFALALSLVLAGALGNLIDRVVIGAVIDFLDFYALGYHWPAFNLADSAITCGAVLLIWDALRPHARDEGGGKRDEATGV